MANTQTGYSVVPDLNWRYATKKFDPAKKISPDVWNQIEDALRLSPSSYGLQPYKFVVVTDSKVKEELVAHSWDQRQVADCSHLVVFSRLASLTAEHVHHYLKHIERDRNVTPESLKQYAGMMLGFVERTPEAQRNEWMTRQAYIALGNLMTSASALHVDNCPMEGFIAAEYDKLLGLEAKGLRSVVLCALGYRAEDDKYAKLPKVRFPADELFIRI